MAHMAEEVGNAQGAHSMAALYNYAWHRWTGKFSSVLYKNNKCKQMNVINVNLYGRSLL